MDQGMRKAALYLAIWQGNFIGVAFGFWLATYAESDGPIRCAVMVTLWLGMTHYVWNRVRRVFWLEDAGQF
jgi:hypothetical protein